MSQSRNRSCNTLVTTSPGNGKEVFTPDQSLLFDGASAAANFDDDQTIRSLISSAIRQCAKSREQIVEEMTALLGEKITLRMLNSYTSEAAEQHRWPLQYTRAFCHVIRDWSLLRCIAERAGFSLITPSESELLALGREYVRQKRASEQIALLEKRLQGVDL